MAVLSTAKDRTEDTCSAAHKDAGVLNITEGIKVSALVTLGTAEEVAGHRAQQGICRRARHTQRATRHDDDT